MLDTLKPCPWCKTSKHLTVEVIFGGRHVHCMYCGCYGPAQDGLDVKTAETKWDDK